MTQLPADSEVYTIVEQLTVDLLVFQAVLAHIVHRKHPDRHARSHGVVCWLNSLRVAQIVCT